MYTSILNVAFSRFFEICCSSKYIKNLYKLFHQRTADLCSTYIQVAGNLLTCIQSTLSKTDTFGTGIKCPSQRDVRLIESQIKGVKKGRDQLQVFVLQRCLHVLQRCPLRESRLYIVFWHLRHPCPATVFFFSAFCSYLELLLLYKEPLNDNN